MSIKVMTRVWEDSTQTEGALLVLLAMADCADHGGVCFPSQEHIAHKARLSERQVRRVINKLISEGELKVIREAAGRGKRTVYKIFPKPGQNVLLSEFEKADIGDTKRRTFETPSNIKKPSIEPSMPPAGDLVSNQADRIAALFKRQKTTPWSEKEVKSWKKLMKFRPYLDEDELTMVERYYKEARKKSDNYCRRDLLTFLNNYPGEVDRARSWCEKHPLPGARKVRAAFDPGPPFPHVDIDPNAPENIAFCKRFERKIGRLPAGYERKGDEIVFVWSNGAKA